MKTKLEMAHEYAMHHITDPQYKNADDLDIISWAWDYADAMQAEADKRIKAKAEKDAEKSKVFFERLTKNEDGSCKHFHTTLNRGECFDCGEKLNMADSPQLEWQPDWSQAPEWANWWVAVANQSGKITGGWFYDVKPEFGFGDGPSVYYSPSRSSILTDSFGYTGDWRNSLRKRPQ